MLPSSSPQLSARFGQLNHYKKFWLLQTQLEKQDQQTSNSSLSLQHAGSTSTSCVNSPATKESNINKAFLPSPNSRSVLYGDNHTTGTTQYGSGCRADMAAMASLSGCSRFNVAGCSCNSSSYCLNEQAASCVSSNHFTYVHRTGHEAAVVKMLMKDEGPRLSLAVNCDVTHDVVKSAGSQQWPTSSSGGPLSPAVVHQVSQMKVQGEKPAAHQNERDSSDSLLEVEKRSWSCSLSQVASTSSAQRLAGNGVQYEQAISTGFRSGIKPPISYDHKMASSVSASLSSSGSPRTCTLCGTTKTPLWRSGPEGPKSLCNACGIRVKKTKRLEAALQATSATSPSPLSSVYKATAFKRKLSSKEPSFVKKKREKAGSVAKRNILMSPLMLKQGESCHQTGTSSPRVKWDFGAPKLAHLLTQSGKDTAKTFAKDVEEAAVMLMALSCGLVLS